MIYRYFKNIFLGFDQLANTFIAGDPDETISSRVGKCQRGDHGLVWQCIGWFFAVLINTLFVWQGWGHCRRSIEADEGANDLILKG